MRKITLRILKKIPTRYITNGIILVMILFAYGIIGSYFIMGLNWVDSVYYAVVTMATVGYGDLTPTNGIQKIFATTLAIGGVGLLAYVFNIILSNFQDKMSEYSKGVRKMKKIDEMDEYYILCGYGRVGKVVYGELIRRNQNVIVFEKDKDVCDGIEDKNNVVVINKDTTEDDLIAKLANEKCKSVIISIGNDVNNLFTVLTIRETNPDAWIVTRASRPENFKRLKKAGADKIVSPERIGGKDLYLQSTKPHLLRLTVRHAPEKITDEFETIKKHDCILENIDYHIPGIKTSLSHEIESDEYLNGNMDALNNLYDSIHQIHSHWISGPDKTTFKKLVTDLEKIEEIIGQNLTDEEIAEITEKELN